MKKKIYLEKWAVIEDKKKKISEMIKNGNYEQSLPQLFESF